MSERVLERLARFAVERGESQVLCGVVVKPYTFVRLMGELEGISVQHSRIDQGYTKVPVYRARGRR